MRSTFGVPASLSFCLFLVALAIAAPLENIKLTPLLYHADSVNILARGRQQVSRQERGGLTMDRCREQWECVKGRMCITLDDEEIVKCRTEDDSCFCLPESLTWDKCFCNDNCIQGEVCIDDKESTVNRTCLSKEFVKLSPDRFDERPCPVPSAPASNAPQPSPSGAACVDARALDEFEQEELIFDAHVHADVLCDERDSCATPGHIVLYHGRAMMMKTYCNMVSCEKKVMLVNSPKYRQAFSWNSNTPGLRFSVLAARYETRLEEMALRTIIFTGF